jgi:hypothetical protein
VMNESIGHVWSASPVQHIYTFAEGEIIADLREVGDAVYVVTNRRIYRVDGDNLRPLVVSNDPVRPVEAPMSPEVLAELLEEAAMSDLSNWFDVAERVLRRYAETQRAPAAEEKSAETPVEPAAFDPHADSPLAADDSFVDGMTQLRERNGLT